MLKFYVKKLSNSRWMDGWMEGWVGGGEDFECKRDFIDSIQQ
jgi:hypothetical protein